MHIECSTPIDDKNFLNAMTMISPSLSVDQIMNTSSLHCISNPEVDMMNIEINFNESVYLMELQIAGNSFRSRIFPYGNETRYADAFGFNVSKQNQYYLNHMCVGKVGPVLIMQLASLVFHND